ncbi:hypothetical protein HU200_054181 [Digitaria exilis]|uniref:Uncharacterized protein n=1 Tax=Digitaria exilis TaxID=1010633 RepID=A0A835AVE3_9POAL|nr:hypothetical protein HU200_054181 [Digitaria exilis]
MAMTAARKAAWVLVVWALAAAAGLGSASARAPLVGSSSKPQREFDYFALSLQWPGTICASTRHCCAINGCCRSEPLQTFTIHGLWPDYDDGTWPSCCRRTQFDLDKILPLMETLQKYWPSLYCSSSSTCFSGKGLFWAHEVQKHGTCSAPVVQDELQYFTIALDLYFKYNVTEMLSSGGIQISNGKEYALSDVIDTIKHAFGGSPQIVCKKGSIQELRLCFDKELKPRDCLTTSLTNGSVSSKKHCPQYISLPSYDPLGKLANKNI